MGRAADRGNKMTRPSGVTIVRKDDRILFSGKIMLHDLPAINVSDMIALLQSETGLASKKLDALRILFIRMERLK
jgi:hypothetical protein